MRVADVMQKDVDFVSVETTVEEASRLIFGRGINGVPVLKEKKVVGFVSERDILAKFYPTIQEYIEDTVHASNFEEMEENVEEIFNLRVEKIMSKDPILISEKAPLLRAQSLMFIHKVGRLPVVDEERNLVGIISKGDIFRALVGQKIPYAVDEEYHDWVSKYYDLITPWRTRLGNEIPDLTSLFRQEKVKKVLDVGCGTGEHEIALAKRGFNVVGLERSTLMFKAAKEKWNNSPQDIKKRIEFIKGEYLKILKGKNWQFDAAIFMGNALPHNAEDYKEILMLASDNLLPKNSFLVLQIVNFQKIFEATKRFQDFNIAPQLFDEKEKEYAFLEFYDPPRKPKDHLTLNMAIFHFDGKRWSPKGFNNTPIANVNQKNLKPILENLGFKEISFYGSKLWGPLFSQPFDPLKSDWLNVVAKR